MGFKKITESQVEMVCMGCGSENVYNVTDLQATKVGISFPVCAECKKSTLTVMVHGGPITARGVAATWYSVAKALHRKLVLANLCSEGISGSDFDENFHDGAIEWPVGSVEVAIELPAIVEIKHAAWLAKQNG